MNINEISVAYLEEKEQHRRASTVDGYRSSINLYILPTFGNCEIGAIEPEAIQAWVDSFEKPGAAEKAFKCLRQLLNWAIRKYRLRIWNPTQGIELPAKPIYRKVIKFGAMTGNYRYTIAHGISYDTIVSFDAIARNSTNSYLPLARVGYNSDNQIDASLNGYAYITPDNAIIIGGSQTNYTGATVIIEYTKA